MPSDSVTLYESSKQSIADATMRRSRRTRKEKAEHLAKVKGKGPSARAEVHSVLEPDVRSRRRRPVCWSSGCR